MSKLKYSSKWVESHCLIIRLRRCLNMALQVIKSPFSLKKTMTISPSSKKKAKSPSFKRKKKSPVSKKTMSPHSEKKKGKQVRWDREMDTIMIDILLEEESCGLKTQNGYSVSSLQKVCRAINEKSELEKCITVDNVRARYRTFTNSYRAAKKVHSVSGFGWNPLSERLTADPLAWDELLKREPEQEKYRYKKVPYFDDLSIIIGDDEATGEGGATGVEADNDMDPIEEIGASHDSSMAYGHEGVEAESRDNGQSSYFASSKKKKRRGNSDPSLEALAEAAQRIANSMELPDVSKLRIELNKIPNISRTFYIKALNYLGGNQKAANIFMGFEDDCRKEWLEMVLGEN